MGCLCLVVCVRRVVDARRKIGENQISLNGTKTDVDHVGSGALIDGRFLLLQRGKKARHLVVVDN